MWSIWCGCLGGFVRSNAVGRRGGSGCGRGMGRLADGGVYFWRGPDKKSASDLCAVVRRIEYPLVGVSRVTQAAYWPSMAKLRLRYNKLAREAWQRLLRSCPTIAGDRKGILILLTTFHKVRRSFFIRSAP